MNSDAPPPAGPGLMPPGKLRRMRVVAGVLLAGAAGLFVVSAWGQVRWPWLAALRACGEAGMIGGIADWFAVTALFRRPLGLPIPHTALIPANRIQIATAIGRFVSGNLLASQAMAEHLEELDTAGKLGRWLCNPTTAAAIADGMAGSLPPIVATIGERRWCDAVGTGLRQAMDAVITAPRMADAVSFLVEHRYHQAMFDHLVEEARRFVAANRPVIRGKVAEGCPEWMPLWVEVEIARGVRRGIDTMLRDLGAHDHPWRLQFEGFLHQMIEKLATSPEFDHRIEEIKSRVLGDPAVDAYLHKAAAEAYGALTGGVFSLDVMIGQAIREFGQRLNDDADTRAALNRWLRRTTESILVPRRDMIGSMIADLVMRWPTEVLIDKIEGHVGNDLQYIRINGTLVGGLVGLVIYALMTLAGR